MGKTPIKKSSNIEKDFPKDELLSIETYYEGKYRKQGIPIKYLCFQL